MCQVNQYKHDLNRRKWVCRLFELIDSELGRSWTVDGGWHLNQIRAHWKFIGNDDDDDDDNDGDDDCCDHVEKLPG